MFWQFPFHILSSIHQTVLIINTTLLIVALIVVELVYSETPKEKRQHLKYFYPLFIILIGLLIYAVVKQVKGA